MSEYTVTGNIMGGRYSPGDSALYSVDPVIKLWVGFLMIALASFSGALILSVLIIVSLSGLKWAGAAFGHILRALKNFIFFFLVIGLFPAFLYDGTPLVMSAYIPFQITWEGLAIGGTGILRFLAMVLISMLLTRTISPLALVKAMEKFMPKRSSGSDPLRDLFKAGFLTMQIIPHLFGEVEKFAASKREEWDVVKGVKKYARLAGLVMPFLIHIFKNMEQLAEILDSAPVDEPTQ